MRLTVTIRVEHAAVVADALRWRMHEPAAAIEEGYLDMAPEVFARYARRIGALAAALDALEWGKAGGDVRVVLSRREWKATAAGLLDKAQDDLTYDDERDVAASLVAAARIEVALKEMRFHARHGHHEWFKQHRVNAGLTRDEVARAVGVSTETIRGWETATEQPPCGDEAQERLATALGLPGVTWLYSPPDRPAREAALA